MEHDDADARRCLAILTDIRTITDNAERELVALGGISASPEAARLVGLLTGILSAYYSVPADRGAAVAELGEAVTAIMRRGLARGGAF